MSSMTVPAEQVGMWVQDASGKKVEYLVSPHDYRMARSIAVEGNLANGAPGREVLFLNPRGDDEQYTVDTTHAQLLERKFPSRKELRKTARFVDDFARRKEALKPKNIARIAARTLVGITVAAGIAYGTVVAGTIVMEAVKYKLSTLFPEPYAGSWSAYQMRSGETISGIAMGCGHELDWRYWSHEIVQKNGDRSFLPGQIEVPVLCHPEYRQRHGLDQR